MVRNYKKKRTGPDVNEEVVQNAIEVVLKNEMSIHQAASTYGLNYSTLFYRIKKMKEHSDTGSKEHDYSSKHSFRQIFTMKQEYMLVEYILKSSTMNYGLTYIQIRTLAYDYAKALNISYPSKWTDAKMAGKEWMFSFMKRHKNLSLRKPENTSLSRCTSFTKAIVEEFHENYAKCLAKHKFTGDRILNVDETGVSTVIQAPNIVAKTGIKQVGQAVSGERGTMITMCAIVNALGNTIPPVFIFPRARVHDSMTVGAPPGSLTLANSPKSGWMTSLLFLKTLEHIKKYTRCSISDPILILMDNHESHCSLDAIMYAKSNGIILITFPPHTTHRLQPLDVAVMGPFKRKLKIAQNDWMRSHPGKAIKINDLLALINTAYQVSFTLKNIVTGFSTPGIWPVSRNAFEEQDYDAAIITEQPHLVESPTAEELLHSPTDIPGEADAQSETRNETFQPEQNQSVSSPEQVWPFPKSDQCKTKKGKREKIKSRILTDTPVKNQIEARTLEREAKKTSKKIKLTIPPAQCLKFRKERKSNSVFSQEKRKFTNVLQSSDTEDNYSVHDDSDISDCPEDVATYDPTDLTELKVNDYVLVKFTTKKTCRHFIGIIEGKEELDFKIKFLKKKDDVWKFYFPDIPDVSLVDFDDIVLKLPPPTLVGGTIRAIAAMTFPINLSKYTIS